MLEKIKKQRFLFEELIKRDFKKKYKGTILGVFWSILAPLLTLLVMALVFTKFFGRNTEHYIIYLFSGNIIFSYFSDATKGGMASLMANASIFSKVDVPKYMFLLSRNIQAFINFMLTFLVYLLFIALEGIPFNWHFLLLIYPIACITVFNIGVGMILSALYMFFRDIEYLYNIFTLLLMYLSAIFYNVDVYSQQVQYLFHLNPVFVYIKYFREIVINNNIPSLGIHVICGLYAVVMIVIGSIIYKTNNHKFLYYV